MVNSVTGVIAKTKQPRGGYIPRKSFSVHTFNRENIIEEPLQEDNVKYASIIGLAVDYISRYLYGDVDEVEAFSISLLGARAYGLMIGNPNEVDAAIELLPTNKILDKDMINNVLKLVNYDAVFRAGYPLQVSPVYLPDYDSITINTVIEMVERSIAFMKSLHEDLYFEFTFEGGYTRRIRTGDGDFMTPTTIFDMKCIRGDITSKHTLQLLIYFILGVASGKEMFSKVDSIGFWNPRFSEYYLLKVKDVEWKIIEEVALTVVAFDNEQFSLLQEHYNNL